MTPFQPTASARIAGLQSVVTTYEHAPTGARHVHLANADAERVFLVAFPTLPTVSDGRAHVLEHLLLCGSQRFPVRDPFFAMMNRSLASFMNAMTYPDQTVYPFATPDPADFLNLMDVYLDATFFPRLDPLDFLQEAWRPVFDGEGRLGLQGVVLNEMKGLTADPRRSLYLGLNRALLPGSPYAVDSGGDPLEIPRLAHADVLGLHAGHYHPSQAVFMTWGDVDPLAVQQRIEQRVLSRFDHRKPPIVPPPVPAWSGTRTLALEVPAAPGAPQEHRLQMAWRLGPDSDLDAVTRARLLETVLLARGGGTLRQAIEAAGFGRMSDQAGLDTSTTEIVLHAGMAGLDEAQVPLARQCIQQALQTTARDGVAPELLRAGVRELRHRERSVRGGVWRLIALARHAVRRHDVLTALDIESRLAALERATEDPAFIRREVMALLEAAPRVVAHVRPDPQFVARRDDAAARFVQGWQAHMMTDERAAILRQAEALARHQQAPHAAADEVLPRIAPGDVSPEPPAMLTLEGPLWQSRALALPTQGLTCAFVKVDLGAADEADWPWLPLYAELLPQLGARGMDHAAAARWRRLRVAALQARCEAQQPLAGPMRVEFTLTVEALREEQGGMAEVAAAWFQAPDFDDDERLHYLLATHVRSRLGRIADEAPQLAALEAQARVSGEGRFQRAAWSLPSLTLLAGLQHDLAGAGLAAARQAFKRIHARLLKAPRVLLCAGMDEDAAPVLRQLQQALGEAGGVVEPAVRPAPEVLVPLALALFAPAQVNHCRVAWQVPAIDHPDAPALAVLAELLQQRLLHPLLRERGGAYGAMARYRHDRGVFECLTQSDPRLAGTFRDVESSLEQLQVQTFTPRERDDAVLGVIKHLDRPLHGVDRLHHAWAEASTGVDPALRRTFRSEVLRCPVEELRRVAAAHLPWSRAHRAAAIGWKDQDTASLEVLDLASLVSGLSS